MTKVFQGSQGGRLLLLEFKLYTEKFITCQEMKKFHVLLGSLSWCTDQPYEQNSCLLCNQLLGLANQKL